MPLKQAHVLSSGSMTVLQVTVLLWGRGHESRCREPGVWGPRSRQVFLLQNSSLKRCLALTQSSPCSLRSQSSPCSLSPLEQKRTGVGRVENGGWPGWAHKGSLRGVRDGRS